MWTVKFLETKSTIGMLEAYFDGEFIYSNSVNIEDNGSIDDFVSNAKAYLEKINSKEDYGDIISKIETILNK